MNSTPLPIPDNASPFRNDSVKELTAILDGEIVGSSVPEEIQWSKVTSLSRNVCAGTLFVAYPGVKTDGAAFIPDAIRSGAELIIAQRRDALESSGGILVKDGRAALSQLAARQHDYPATKLKLAGITGTNGKTTTNWCVSHALSSLGSYSANIGTYGFFYDDHFEEAIATTTPPATELQRMLAELVAAGKQSCAIEVTSHGLDQRRVAGVPFEVGVFLNLTPDHLDYHPDIEAYYQAKKMLFDLTKKAVVNIDCEYGERLARELQGLELLTFGTGADIEIDSFVQDVSKSTLTLCYQEKQYKIATPFFGSFNASNLTAAFGACLHLGFDPQKIAQALSEVPQAPGRLERYSYNGAHIFIDYAHEEQALGRALGVLREITKGELAVLFGVGGDRDPGRRPGMGRAAKSYADKVYLTSDNPRTEDPENIINDILQSGVEPQSIEPDRKKAISKAILELQPHDVLLIAGKGHEEYQIIGSDLVHLSDREEVLKTIGGKDI